MDDDIKREEAIVADYIKAHPWPSYKTMSKRLAKHASLWAEYGEPNHMALKLCYENIHDKEVCRKAGEFIAKRGGFQAMQANFYAFSCFGPFGESPDLVIRCQGNYLQHQWNHIKDDTGHEWLS
jgi:hypothetical protein